MAECSPFPELRNWWCPKCRRWIAGCETNLQKEHNIPGCHAKAKWQPYDVNSPSEPVQEPAAVQGEP